MGKYDNMRWEDEWRFYEQRRLARYANEAMVRWLPHHARLSDEVLNRPDARYERSRQIYNVLAEAGIVYSKEPVTFATSRQRVRQPVEYFQSPRLATCLDLAVLFGGICLAFDLLTLLVLTRGHAFVAISRIQSRTDLKVNRRSDALRFDDGLLLSESQAMLRKLIDRRSYFALECTGIAYTSEAGPMPERNALRSIGRMDFDTAVEAGRRQLDLEERPLLFALDLHTLHLKDPPYEIELPTTSYQETPKTIQPLLRTLALVGATPHRFAAVRWREIEALQGSVFAPDQVVVEPALALDAIGALMAKEQPQIVYLSCESDATGVTWASAETSHLTWLELADTLLRATPPSVELVILMADSSLAAGQRLNHAGLAVIAAPSSIGQTIKAFAPAFLRPLYFALGRGQDIGSAFQAGLYGIKEEGGPEPAPLVLLLPDVPGV